MSDNIKTKTYFDIEGNIDEDIDLRHFLGQEKVVRILQTLIDKHHNDASEGRMTPIKPILLVGQSSCSLLARAFSNTLGNLCFHKLPANLINYGISFAEFYLDGNDCHSTHFLQNIESMTFLNNYALYQLLNKNIIEVPKSVAYKNAEKIKYEGQLIFSTKDTNLIPKGILGKFETVCFLKEYTKAVIVTILQQRIKYLGWVVQKEEVVWSLIVNATHCDIGLALKVLDWSYKCSRSTGKEEIGITEFNKALHMLQ